MQRAVRLPDGRRIVRRVLTTPGQTNSGVLVLYQLGYGHATMGVVVVVVIIVVVVVVGVVIVVVEVLKVAICSARAFSCCLNSLSRLLRVPTLAAASANVMIPNTAMIPSKMNWIMFGEAAMIVHRYFYSSRSECQQQVYQFI